MGPVDPQIVAELYLAFSTEPRPTAIPDADRELGSAGCRKLLDTPLRELRAEDLRPYLTGAFFSFGSPKDFVYFLPRLLEIQAISGFTLWSEYLGPKIARAVWDTLSRAQKAIISCYYADVVGRMLAREHQTGSELDALLSGTSHFLPGWDEILRQLANHPPALRALISWFTFGKGQSISLGEFWDDSPRKRDFLQWLTSEEIQVRAWSEP